MSLMSLTARFSSFHELISLEPEERRARIGQSAVVPYGMATLTPRPVRSPLLCGRVRRRPRSQGARCSTRIAASSARGSAPAKPRRPRSYAPTLIANTI